jgi:hypothetical protein
LRAAVAANASSVRRSARIGPAFWLKSGGRGRDFALRQLRSLAAHGGYPVRPGYRARRRVVLPSA